MTVHFSQPFDNPSEFLEKLQTSRENMLDMAMEGIDSVTKSPAELRGELEGLQGRGRPQAPDKAAQLKALADELAGEVNAGRLTPEQAHERLRQGGAP
jgi:hypothetical protein